MLVFKFQQSLLTTLMEIVTGPSGAECACLEPGGWVLLRVAGSPHLFTVLSIFQLFPLIIHSRPMREGHKKAESEQRAHTEPTP